MTVSGMVNIEWFQYMYSGCTAYLQIVIAPMMLATIPQARAETPGSTTFLAAALFAFICMPQTPLWGG